MVDLIAKAAELGTKLEKMKRNTSNLDKPLKNGEGTKIKDTNQNRQAIVGRLDAPLNSKEDKLESKKHNNEINEKEKIEKMQPQIVLEFKCPEGMDKKEFTRQLKGQERGLNSQTVAQNIDNRAAYNLRKLETGNGRDMTDGKKAQEIAREKALSNRIKTNLKKGMSYSDAKKEADEWIKTQDALHNPDQIAGGDPSKVSRMGDANVNRSIGNQWKTNVDKLQKEIDGYAKDKTREELENTKMNVKLVVV